MPTFQSMSLLVLMVIGQSAAAQTIQVKVRVVNVLASVRDTAGRSVRDLERSDFSIEEDGIVQSVKYFSTEGDLPLSLGLLVDVSRSQDSVLEKEQRASAVFLEQMLKRPDDQALVIRFGEEVDVLQGLTSSVPKLTSTLSQLKLPGGVPLSASNRQCNGKSFTPLYDAIVTAAEAMRKTRTPRRALVVLTNGLDHNSCHSLTDAINTALRMDVAVYTIFFAGEQSAVPDKYGEDVVKKIAAATGGRVFILSEDTTIEQSFELIGADLRYGYSLGYVSNRPTTRREYRKIRVTVVRPGLSVTARDGYYTNDARSSR